MSAAPLAFGSSVADDRFRSREAVEKILGGGDNNVVFGLLQEQLLLGMAGLYLYRSTSAKERHKAFIWGMFVRGLYHKAGFVEWGTEPRALHWQGAFIDELHLVLALDASARGPHCD